MSARVAALGLVVLIVGLAMHNVAMALLWQAGVRDTALDVVAAWKELVLGIAVAAALAAGRAFSTRLWADRLALAYALLVVLYLLLPQSLLGGEATARGELYALRHHLLPVAAYALGRLLVLDRGDWHRLGLAVVAVAAGLAAWGLVDVYAIPLQTWRGSGVPGWYHDQLGLTYECLSRLPENWVLNTGDEQNPLRRLVSTFLSPLATGYALVIALLLLASVRRRPWTLVVSGLVLLGLLWTHTRAAFVALAFGLFVLGALRRSWAHVGLGVAWVAVSAAFVVAFPTIGPSTTYTAAELTCLRENAATDPDGAQDPLGRDDSSTASHFRNLRDGIEAVARQPWGYGLGNAGVNASRTGVPLQAGESTYTELGVDTGLLGLATFVGWLVALGLGLARRSPWLAASLAAVALIGIQTDVIGIHWLAVTVFALAGAALRAAPREHLL